MADRIALYLRTSKVKDYSVVGLDLSGPATPEATGVAVFNPLPDGLIEGAREYGGSDQEIFQLVQDLASIGPVILGVDAPLSYSAGGGLRVRDRSLQRAIKQIGMHPRHVIAPMAPKMVYLTLRGISLSRLFSSSRGNKISIAEVHPTACLGLRGAPLADVVQFKTVQASRENLLAWFPTQGVHPRPVTGCSDHFIAACSAALAAWKWHQRDSVWRENAEPPWHPYDFVC